MPEPFVVAFVVGVTPGKWARVWEERLADVPLDLRPLSPADALAALGSGQAHAALVRLPVEDQGLSSIVLYEELPVVVVAKDHAIEALDSVTAADLTAENVITGDWAAAVELAATGAGVAVMPQSVARALSRRDVVARPVTDGATTSIALAWVTDSTTPEIEEFIGIVRGRTANSSRGTPTPPTPPPPKKPKVPRPQAKRPTGVRHPRKPKRR